MRRTGTDPGFTIVEMAISITVLSVLLVGVCSIFLETSNQIGDNDVASALQTEGGRAFRRLSEVLRKSGRAQLAGISYPRVTGGGASLEFLVLQDNDGNGYAFNASTGALEWKPKVFTIRADAQGNLGVFDGVAMDFLLGRFARVVNFRTIAEDPLLHLKEIQVFLQFDRTTKSGYTLRHTVSGSVNMRN